MPSCRRSLTLAVALAACAVAAATARAECKADVQKLCAKEPAAGGKVQACLETNAAQLSAPCKKRLAAIGARKGPLAGPCRYDIVLFCADVAPGGGRIADCLDAKRDQLTPECKETVGKTGKP